MYFDVAKKKWTCIHEEDINIDKIEKMPVMIVIEFSDTESLRNKGLWRLIDERIDDSVNLPLEVGLLLLLDHGFTREVYEKLVDYIVREGFDKRVNS